MYTFFIENHHTLKVFIDSIDLNVLLIKTIRRKYMVIVAYGQRHRGCRLYKHSDTCIYGGHIFL